MQMFDTIIVAGPPGRQSIKIVETLPVHRAATQQKTFSANKLPKFMAAISKVDGFRRGGLFFSSANNS